MKEIQDFAAASKAADAEINASIDNIVGDEAGLNKLIKDLEDQLSSSTLTQADKDALQSQLDSKKALAAKLKQVADSIQDAPAPPAV